MHKNVKRKNDVFFPPLHIIFGDFDQWMAVNVLWLLEGRCAQLGVRLASVKNLGFQIETGLPQDKASDLKHHRLTTALPV